MNASLARWRGLIAVNVGYLGLLLLLESGFPIFPVLMLQGPVQDGNNGDRDRHDEEWNQPVEDSHWGAGFCARHLLSHWCALPDNAGQSLNRTWRHIGRYLAGSCEHRSVCACRVRTFPRFATATRPGCGVHGVLLSQIPQRVALLCATAASRYRRVTRSIGGGQRGRTCAIVGTAYGPRMKGPNTADFPCVQRNLSWDACPLSARPVEWRHNGV